MSVINVIQAQDGLVFDELLFPHQSPNINNYIVNQLNSFSNSLTDFGQKFMSATKDIYDKVNDSHALRVARASIRMAKGLFHPNAIVPLETIDEIRSAQPVMQRYIMAEPYIRDLYHRQLCDGYSDTYSDVDPGVIGDQHYDYRRVMTGVIQDEVHENGQDTWVARQFFDELRPEDRELDHHERHQILNIWDISRMFAQAGKDPTDMFSKE